MPETVAEYLERMNTHNAVNTLEHTSPIYTLYLQKGNRKSFDSGLCSTCSQVQNEHSAHNEHSEHTSFTKLSDTNIGNCHKGYILCSSVFNRVQTRFRTFKNFISCNVPGDIKGNIAMIQCWLEGEYKRAGYWAPTKEEIEALKPKQESENEDREKVKEVAREQDNEGSVREDWFA